jgi:Tfp pilus assembly protein PilO
VTARDRTVLIVVGFLAVLGGFWFLAISPKRKDSADVEQQVAAAQSRLDTAQASASSAEAAKAKYSTDYATVARLGKAVPVDDDMPSLVYQLEQTAKANKVDFRSRPRRRPRAPARSPPRCRPARRSAPPASRRCRSRSTSPARSSTCSGS